MATSRDIAKVARVSQTTVSRVLRNSPKVRAETRERVLRTIREMNYSPNGLARAMITRNTGTIGVVVEDITNPFYPEIVEAFCEELAVVGRRMILWNSREAGEESALEAIRQRLVDGIVFTTALPDSPVLREAVSYGAPVVLVNRHVEDANYDRVTTDNVRGGRLIADYFVGRGHDKIGLITGSETASTSVERERGFRAGLAAYGIGSGDILHRSGGFSYERSYGAMRGLLGLNDPPTAVFCINDFMAFAALNAARACGTRVPEDMWVVGFDDIEMAAWEAFDLTTVRQPISEMVREAVKLLLERIREPGRTPQHLRLGGGEVIVRGSTAHWRGSHTAPN